TRIAAAGGIHPTVIGLSEGLQGSSLNAGNYGQARRRVSDGTLRPLWRDFAGSFETLVPPPSGAELWYDDRDIAFLRDDEQDLATIRQTDASSIRQLVDAGFTPASVVAAIQADDMNLLEHTNLFSVQLQAPGSTAPDSGVSDE
ncbi:MAG: phage portal protein, partial [Acidimicrobiia bacterium]|nr:phage portal protein [Acidimicrobiia bacterium]